MTIISFLNMLKTVNLKILRLIIYFTILYCHTISFSQNMVSNYGQLIGQCQAMYDLNLIQDRNSKIYIEKIINSWNNSDKRSIRDFNESYIKTKNILQERRQLFGERDAVAFAKLMYPSYIATLSSNSGIKDINNSGQAILLEEQRKTENENNNYKSRIFGNDQLEKNHGWYIELISCRSSYTLETVNRSLKSNQNKINSHPLRACEINGEYGLWLGPFPSSQEAADYYGKNIYDFTEFNVGKKTFQNENGRAVIWTNGNKYLPTNSNSNQSVKSQNNNQNSEKDIILKRIYTLHPDLFSQLGILHAFYEYGLLQNNTNGNGIPDIVKKYSNGLLLPTDNTGAYINFNKLKSLTLDEIKSKQNASNNQDFQIWTNDRFTKALTSFNSLTESRNSLINQYNAINK